MWGQSKRKEDGTPQKPWGIRWVLFAYLAVFCVAILLLTWLSQTFLLNTLYTRVALSRMQAAAAELTKIADEGDGQIGAQVVSVNYQIGVAVFSAGDDGLGERRLWAVGDGGSILSRLPNVEYAALYAAALENGGEETRTYSDHVSFSAAARAGREKDAPGGASSLRADLHRLVYVRLAQTAAGDEIAIFLDAAEMPVGTAAGGALRAEILILSVALVAGAACLAWAMSRRIVAPIRRLTEKARHLAGGHYEVTVSKKAGYREAEALSATLDYAASELAKVDGLQKELIANISHDLRTPLTMIVGYAEIMRDIEGENKPENVQVIIDEAKRLSALVDDLLQISRYQAGCEKLDLSSFDLADELRAMGARYARLLEGRGFTIHVQAQEDLPVCADRARLLQVVSNLLNNAVNYSGDSREIELRGYLTSAGHARVEVVDFGEGIAPDKLTDIWQRYYKVDAQHKRSVVGSGLGLSIVRGILELHHARYGVESKLGEGSTFWFELPPASPPPASYGP